jgi:hypothetical protein
MIRYAWFKSGYTDVDPRPFQMVSHVLNLNKITATCLHATNSCSFDAAIAPKYYVYKTFFLIIILMVSDLSKHKPLFL